MVDGSGDAVGVFEIIRTETSDGALQTQRTEGVHQFRKIRAVRPGVMAAGQTQTEIGAATYRDRPSMSRILSGMERRGWVERRADESNQRIWRIALRRTKRPRLSTLSVV